MTRPRETDEVIRRVLTETRTIAVVGASPNPARTSHRIMAFLQDIGYRALPVNPMAAGETILGETCRGSLAEIDEPIDMVDVFRRADALAGVVDDVLALETLPKVLWTQLDVVDEAAAARAEAAGLTVVMDRCPKIEYPRLFRDRA